MTNDHFSVEASGTPTAAGRFVRPDRIAPVEYVPGLQFRPVLGENMLANFVTFEPHTEAPLHVHAEEQIVVVVEGQFDFTIDAETLTMRVGDVAVVPPWVPHGAVTGDIACREIDVFNPPRATLVEPARLAAPGSVVGRAAGEDAG